MFEWATHCRSSSSRTSLAFFMTRTEPIFSRSHQPLIQKFPG